MPYADVMIDCYLQNYYTSYKIFGGFEADLMCTQEIMGKNNNQDH